MSLTAWEIWEDVASELNSPNRVHYSTGLPDNKHRHPVGEAGNDRSLEER